MTLTRQAPAKINLHLRVFPRAADGFHPLRSWFRTIALADSLHVTRLRRQPDPPPPEFPAARVDLRCDLPGLPLDETNLVARAWLQMAVALGDEPEWVRIELEKRIPTGAGLGGGSSDAAAAIAAYPWARQEAGLSEPSRRQMLGVAGFVGSDVPFFVHHQLDGITDATCSGRGDIVQPFSAARRHVVLLMLSEAHVATPAVYGQFDALPAPPPDDEPDFAAWSALAALQLLPLLRNDLEPAAFGLHPLLAQLHRQAEERLSRPVRMSGSGSALFSLYDTRQEAEEAMQRLADLPVRPVLA